jgi:hypothetical protein
MIAMLLAEFAGSRKCLRHILQSSVINCKYGYDYEVI